MSSAESTVPYGYCHCGCGQRTNLSKGYHHGIKRGEPNRFLRGHGQRPTGPRYRVDPATGCWEWLWCKDRNGYGRGSRVVGGPTMLAHRMVYEDAHGPIPEGLSLDHLCRNPSCVNPDHLDAVSHAVNCRRGNATKLTWDDVHAIRASSETHRVLSERYGVSGCAISNIQNYKRWKEG